MRALVRHAVARLRVRWGRALLAAGGIAAASAMLGAAVTVAFSLHDGFQRAADRADLPDVIARFDQRDLSTVRERVGALPNVAGVSYRYEERRVHLWSHGIPEISSGQLEGVQPGRRGYAVVAGRDLRDGSGEAVIEQGLAKEWHLQPGDTISFRTSTPPVSAQQLRIVGVAVSPDNVAYPLASAPRVWVPYRLVASYFAPDARQPVNQALVWVHDPDRLDVTLEQARTASFGIGGLVFATRDAVRIQIDQAAGIVIALLVAFSLVALAGAVVMLAASSRVEVERRIESFALLRALGASPRAIVAATAAEAMLVALPAAVLGLLVERSPHAARPTACWRRSTSSPPGGRCSDRSRSASAWSSGWWPPPRAGPSGAHAAGPLLRCCAAGSADRRLAAADCRREPSGWGSGWWSRGRCERSPPRPCSPRPAR